MLYIDIGAFYFFKTSSIFHSTDFTTSLYNPNQLYSRHKETSEMVQG